MKVAFFTNEYPPYVYGGAGVHVDYLSRELAKLCPLTVKCFGDQNLNLGNLNITGVTMDPRVLEGIPKELTYVFSSFHRCLKFFNPPFDAEIIHCHTWYSHFAGILAKLAYGIPLVVTTHSLEPLRPWKREQIGLGFDVSSWVEREALELADIIIAVSEGTRHDVVNHFSVNPEKIHIVPNGIDTDEYKPVSDTRTLLKYGIDPNSPYLLFVGRITRQKGIIYLVDAIAHLDPYIQIVLCAGAPDTEEIKEEMETHVRTVKKKRDNIVWISEMLPVPEKVSLYSNASVFCCPSIYEPFGIINLEAMSCGTPVVGTKVGGIPEVVEDGKTGMLVPVDLDPSQGNIPKDPQKFSRDLAKAINHLFKDDELRESMGKRSRERAIDIYSWKKIAKQIYELYEAVLAPKNQKGEKF